MWTLNSFDDDHSCYYAATVVVAAAAAAVGCSYAFDGTASSWASVDCRRAAVAAEAPNCYSNTSFSNSLPIVFFSTSNQAKRNKISCYFIFSIFFSCYYLFYESI